MTRRELEQALETRCVERIEALGGMALKLVIPGVRGFPDRSCMLPGARIFFIEFKRLRTGRVSAQQHTFRVLLHQMGFGYYTIDTDEQFYEALEREMGR